MKALVTAGPTYEHIDPVRFIGNHSSGKMGIELAEELKRRGYDVTLVIGPSQLTSSEGINRIDVVSADEMYDACMKEFPTCDVAIMSAAVADYKPAVVSDTKIKRNGNNLTIELVPNRDIAAALGKIKKANQKLIGFALETNNGVDNAIRKIQSKNLDMIVLNQIGEVGVGFKSDTNKVTLIKHKNKALYVTTKYSDIMSVFRDSIEKYKEGLEQNPFLAGTHTLIKDSIQGVTKIAEENLSDHIEMFFDKTEFETKSKAEVAKDIIDAI